MSKGDQKQLKTILDGCKKLQPKWQRVLYDLLFESVLLTISKFKLTTPEAEDLMQETFIKIFNNLNRYDPEKASINTWASMIAKRLTINYCNSKYRQNLMESINESTQKQAVKEFASTDFDWERMQRAINQIPGKYKTVLELSIFQGLKHTAISEELGISESTSRVYLSRALELIRKDFKSLAL